MCDNVIAKKLKGGARVEALRELGAWWDTLPPSARTLASDMAAAYVLAAAEQPAKLLRYWIATGCTRPLHSLRLLLDLAASIDPSILPESPRKGS